MSEHTAGPKINIDGDLVVSDRPSQYPLTVVGVLQNPAGFISAGFIFCYYLCTDSNIS